MNGPVITKGELHFSMNEDGEFICHEMLEVAKRFSEQHTSEEVQAIVEAHCDVLAESYQIRCSSKKEYDSISEEDRHSQGKKIFLEILATIRDNLPEMNSFQTFLFWLGDWWYYHPEIRTRISLGDDGRNVFEDSTRLIREHLLPILPEQVQDAVKSHTVVEVAVGFNHFVIMFVDENAEVRRFVTDTQLFEIRDVFGYIYLDVLPNGKPVARSRTGRGGERCFFDGTRLMSHSQFQTCAPKTVVFEGGYKINSTEVTIINGILYPLIDIDDKVAYTTGVWNWGPMRCCEFSNEEAIESYKLSEDSAARLKICETGVVTIGDRTIKPIGIFQPSNKTLLDSGFTWYDWSEFHEILSIQHKTVMVVDDDENWVNKVEIAIGKEVGDGLSTCVTNDKTAALSRILEVKPSAVILDMHLTVDEQFDGLWIANQLAEHEWQGEILIASGYPDEQLEAMAKLIKRPVKTPGKNIERVIAALAGVDR